MPDKFIQDVRDGILKISGPSCDCEECRHACQEVPGWFTPVEAVRAINAGYAKRMSAVRERGVYALAPSIAGAEGEITIFWPGCCNFFTQEGKCEIHNSGFKPVECRAGYGCRPTPEYPEIGVMYELWRSTDGIKAIELWLEEKVK